MEVKTISRQKNEPKFVGVNKFLGQNGLVTPEESTASLPTVNTKSRSLKKNYALLEASIIYA